MQHEAVSRAIQTNYQPELRWWNLESASIPSTKLPTQQFRFSSTPMRRFMEALVLARILQRVFVMVLSLVLSSLLKSKLRKYPRIWVRM